MVATIAFGLGIDKGDVRYALFVASLSIFSLFHRYIIHYDLPKSFEGERVPSVFLLRYVIPSHRILSRDR